jgi:hypothetical protein
MASMELAAFTAVKQCNIPEQSPLRRIDGAVFWRSMPSSGCLTSMKVSMTGEQEL